MFFRGVVAYLLLITVLRRNYILFDSVWKTFTSCGVIFCDIQLYDVDILLILYQVTSNELIKSLEIQFPALGTYFCVSCCILYVSDQQPFDKAFLG